MPVVRQCVSWFFLLVILVCGIVSALVEVCVAISAIRLQISARRCDRRHRRSRSIPLPALLDFQPAIGNRLPQVILPTSVGIFFCEDRALCTLSALFRNCTMHCAGSEGCMYALHLQYTVQLCVPLFAAHSLCPQGSLELCQLGVS